MTVMQPAEQAVPTPADEPPEGGRRRTGKGHIDSYGRGRVCEAPDCQTELSRYNATGACWLHDEARSLLVSGWVR